MVNWTVWLLWLSISLSIQEFHSWFFHISCSLSASPIIISSLLSSSQMLLINKSTHSISKYYLIVILLILISFLILFIFILFNHHIQSLSYHYYLKLLFWMILFSSNHHHSHILSQSILYHSMRPEAKRAQLRQRRKRRTSLCWRKNCMLNGKRKWSSGVNKVKQTFWH